MKKIIAVLAVILMLLTACGNTSIDSSEETVPDNVPGVSENSGSSVASDGTSSSVESTESTQTAPESTVREKPIVPENPQGGDMYDSGIAVLNDGRAFNLYGGGYDEGRNYAETFNEIKKRVGGNVNVFSMVIPTKASFYLPEKYADYSGSEWDNIEYLNDFFDGIIPVDAYYAA